MTNLNCNWGVYPGLPGYEAFESKPCWHVLWTRSNCERKVHDQLREKGFELFLQTVYKLSRNVKAQRLYERPLFPGYLFVRHAMDRYSYLDIARTRGLSRVLGERWDKLARVPDDEIDAIRRVQEAGLPRMPYKYLQAGARVRITSGSLKDVEGIFVRHEENRGLLILSVNLLSRSLAVTVDRSQVMPVS